MTSGQRDAAPRSVQATLDEETALLLASLVKSSGLSRWRWVRGAILAAAADPKVAAAIAEAAPPERRGGPRPGAGGRRPGAGRPRRTSQLRATDDGASAEKGNG